MTTSSDLLLQIYQELFRQKNVLPNAPTMTIPETEQTPDKFNKEKANLETAAVVGYLLGQKDVLNEDWDMLFQLVKKYYDNQPEWKKILLDYLEYLLELRTEKNIQVQEELKKEIEAFLKNQPK